MPDTQAYLVKNKQTGVTCGVTRKMFYGLIETESDLYEDARPMPTAPKAPAKAKTKGKAKADAASTE